MYYTSVGKEASRMTATRNETGRSLRVFVAGGSGAIGQALIPKLVEKGYDVTAMTRTPGKAESITRMA